MKKVFILMFMFSVLGLTKLFCANEIYQNYGSYYDISIATSTAITVSSSTITTVAAVNEGVNRVFKINGTPTAKLYFQRGGTSSTVLTNGIPLDTTVYYTEDSYFGAIYFISDTGDIDLRASILRRQ